MRLKTTEVGNPYEGNGIGRTNTGKENEHMGQITVPEKKFEITAVSELIKMLDIAGDWQARSEGRGSGRERVDGSDGQNSVQSDS